jgi:hypothetical protein
LSARAEAAEQAVLIEQAKALRALHRAAAAERWAEVAEDMAAQTERARRRALRVPSSAVYEYRGEVCRLCGWPAPPPRAHRRDGLRVCLLESCGEEARRRDNVLEQRNSIARKRAQQAE